MQLVNRVELKVENYDKCNMICDHDCPLGQLYDYACAFQSFILQRMKEADEAQKAQNQEAQTQEEKAA